MSDSSEQPPQLASALVREDEISDRRAYERDCLAELNGFHGWREPGFELLGAELVGEFPDTFIAIRYRDPDHEQVFDEDWEIWKGEGGLHRDRNGVMFRWAPRMLIEQHLMPVYWER